VPQDGAPSSLNRDPGPRVITIEKWASTAGFALAWAIYGNRLVVFTRNDFGNPETVLVEKRINSSAVEEIRAEIETLLRGVIGKAFSKKHVWDGTFYRISFSSAGQLTSDRVEFENLYLPEVAKLLETVDRCVPDKYKIRYKETERMRRVENFETVVKEVDLP
jgi:hypothetical protein